MNIIMLDTEMWNYFIEGITGKKSIVCIERIGEVAGIGERSPCEETGYGYSPVYAGLGDGPGPSSSSEDRNC